MKKLEDMHDRLDKVQYALYQSENPDSRFDKIYSKFCEFEANRLQDV